MKIKLHYPFLTWVVMTCKHHLQNKQMKMKSCTYVDVQFKFDHKHKYYNIQITEKHSYS